MKQFFILLGLSICLMSLSAQEAYQYNQFYYQRSTLFEKLPIDSDDIVFLGNSITNGCEWHELFNNPNIKNRGISSDVSMGVYDRLDPIIKGKPAKIFLMIGINDIAHHLLTGSKSDEHPAILRMDGNGMYDDLPEQEVIFRGRGNSTWNMKKKPYRFKMDKKTAVCGMKKAKSFALIANYIDCSLMRNTVALWLANYLEMPFANHCIPVKVYFNGICKGQYMLTEKTGIGSGSVDIDEEKGMLFEIDSNYDEDYKFAYDLYSHTAVQNGNNNQGTLPVMIADPDLTEIAPALGLTADEYFDTWKNDFSTMLTAVMTTPSTGSLKKYIDIESVVNFFMVNSLSSNHEMEHPKSFKLYKDSLNGVYKFGPVWDFDWAFTFDGREGAPANTPMVDNNGDCGGYTFIKALLSNEEIRTLYQQKWNAFVKDGYPELKAYMEEYATLIEPSAKENGVLWPADYSVDWRLSESSFDFRENFDKLKAWIQQRINYCNEDPNFGLYR